MVKVDLLAIRQRATEVSLQNLTKRARRRPQRKRTVCVESLKLNNRISYSISFRSIYGSIVYIVEASRYMFHYIFIYQG